MDAQEKIKQQVSGNPVVLYMKGTPDAPMCGFSAAAVQILEACGVENVATVDVLADQDIRQGIKEFSKLAHDSAAVRQRRVRRRRGHHARDVSVRRTAETAGQIGASAE